MFKIILTILIVYLEDYVLTVKTKIECGYKQCPQTRDGALNVHVIPHSHMDAGWVKTFDEYYFGTRSTVSTANVQLIYHSVLSELLHDKRRKFTFSETAYFWRWWKEQRPATRATFRSLVQEGRIEFAGGGWVQNDEATLDYLQIIDHYTWGLRKLNDTLGPCGKPKAAWQIDTYGHTREQTSLLAQMGFDGMFLGRVDHKEREAMIEEDRMEFMWRGSDILGKMSDIMTHTLFNLYNAPDGFCFDFLCSDEPIVDDPDNRVYNAEKRVNDFIVQIERQAKYYDHDNIVVTMGGDFTYQGAANWFMSIDKLINHVNTHPANLSDVNIFYSTPSCYLKAIYLYGRRDKAIYTERGDHMPYGSDKNTYWTGYYTSRPSLKYFIRKSHVFLQVVKQLTVITRMGDSYELHLLRHAVNLVLHHDAITGTSQQHVTNDFIKTLSEAVDACTKKVSNLLSYITPTWGGTRRAKNFQQFVICHQLNMSQCRFTETQETMLLLVYNPSSVKTYHHVRIPAIALHYSIRDYNDEEVEYQLVPLPTAVINLPGRASTAIQELCFEAENIPPLGFASYYISPVRDQLEENEFAKKVAQLNKNPAEPEQEIVPTISNEYLKIGVNKDTGLLEYIQHVDGVRVELSQNFHYYSQGSQGLQSGAYSFRPSQNRPIPVTERVTYHAIRGTLVKEIRQRFNDWITQVIRLYRGEEFVELEWIIGPVPIGADLGKEVVSLFHTNVTSSGLFYTDSNSRQMMKRTCWNESATQQQKKPVASCYYPVASRICIKSLNTSVAMCVLTDRTQGGTSYSQGELELMVHRRLLTDDGFGLEEPLNEEAFGVGLVVKGKHRIVFGNFRQETEEQTFDERVAQASRRWMMEPWLFMTPGEKINRRKWINLRSKRFSALRLHALPRHVHILTLEPWKGGSVLLRLENTLENPVRGHYQNEKPEALEEIAAKSAHINVHLRTLFAQMKIKMVRETTLAANQWLDDARQMDWSTRYVYSGADDEILPEDTSEYRESLKEAVSKEADRFSDEDQDYTRKNVLKRRLDKGRSKIKLHPNFEDRYRKKRSANVTENIVENIINGTFKDKEENNTKTTKLTTTEKATTQYYNLTTKPTNIDIILDHNIKDKTKTSVTRQPRLSFLNSGSTWIRPSKFFVDLEGDSEEGVSSEEDVSSRFRKKASRRKAKSKKKHRETEIEIDDSDDGITKSMYEMYYKTQAYTRPFKTIMRKMETERFRGRNRKQSRRIKINEEESNIKRNRNDDTPSFIDNFRPDFKKRSRNRNKKGKILRVDMPFFITETGKKFNMKKRGYTEDSLEYKVRDESEEKGEDKDTEKRKEASTLKRPRSKKREESMYAHDYESITVDLDEEEKEMEHEDRDASEGRRTERTKRDAAPDEPQVEPTSEAETDPDPEYVVTLRPTQIRTFVVWFESHRKPYTI